MVASTQDTKAESSGFQGGHAYSIMSTHEVERDNQIIHLLRLRNPWGLFTWKGAWSNSDATNWTPELKQ
jgi:hypothetical protein